MDGWNVALLAAASYVAVVVLVRFMLAHRDRVLRRFRDRMVAAREKAPRERAPVDEQAEAGQRRRDAA